MMREYTSQAGRAWAEYGNTKPGQRKFVIFGAVALVFFLFVGAMAPSYAPERVNQVKGMLGGAASGNA